MESLVYEQSTDTPGIILDQINNIHKISGKSYPSEAKKFYEPVLNWLKEYIENPNQKTVFQFKLDYYNSASARQIIEILYLLENLYKKNYDVKVKWIYLDIDDDMLETGKEYEEMTEIPFEFSPFKDDD